MKKLINFNCRVSDSTVSLGNCEINCDYKSFEIADEDKLWAVNWAICFFIDNHLISYSATKDYDEFCPAFMEPALKALGRRYDKYEKVPVNIEVRWEQNEFWIDINLK